MEALPKPLKSVRFSTPWLRHLLPLLMLVGFFMCSEQAFAQEEEASDKEEPIVLIGRLIMDGEGSKIYGAKYQVLKEVQGKVNTAFVVVAYYFWTATEPLPTYAALKLNRYPGAAKTENYYLCPGYDAKSGIQPVQVSEIGVDHWRACETVEGPCEKLTFTRDPAFEHWVLKLPCGGTHTAVWLRGEGIEQKFEGDWSQCPPVFDLSTLPDGEYSCSMVACGLGGTVFFQLESDPAMNPNQD